jgi:hypothetical protein
MRASVTTAPRRFGSSALSIPAVLPWLLIVAEAVLAVAFFAHEHDLGTRGLDFRANVWDPMQLILDGESPYGEPGALAERGATFGYPPLIALVFLPLTVLPYKVAALVFALVLAAASVGAVRAVGVRDVRCLLLVLLSLPVVSACYWGNPTPLVVLAGGLAWRWRDHAWGAPLAIAAGVAVKFLAWPLVVWLALTRRVASAVRAALLSVVLVLAPWALIGFDGLGQYPDLLQEIGDAGAADGLLVQAAAERAGAPGGVATALALAAAAGVLVAAALVRSDRAAYCLASLAGIVSSPLAWIYYLAVVAVIVGVWRRTFSPAWLFVAALWVVGLALHPHSGAVNVFTLALTGVLVGWIARSSRDEARRPDSPRSPATMGAAADPA